MRSFLIATDTQAISQPSSAFLLLQLAHLSDHLDFLFYYLTGSFLHFSPILLVATATI